MKFIKSILIILIMFFFKNNVLASYDKLFYDFSINDISGKELNFVNFKDNG